MIISFMSQKGGVGKSTLAIHAAEMLHRYGHNVLLIDADPQQSTLDWSAGRPDKEDGEHFPVMGKAQPTIHKEINQIAKGYDYVIIDGAPRLEELGASIIAASDVIVIPVRASSIDVWATDAIIKVIERAKISAKPDLLACMIFSQVIKKTRIAGAVQKALQAMDAELLTGSIANRVGFSESTSTGKTVMDMPNQKSAIKEIEIMVNQILEFVRRNQNKEAA